MVEQLFYHLSRVCWKSFSWGRVWGVGCRVLPIFRGSIT